jgi:hypothetical protein
MINQYTLHEIANNLAIHENSKRIKKLIFCACKNIWQNDPSILDNFKFLDLITELYHNHPTVDHVNYTLSQIVNTLNKPGEYSLVANIILGEIQQLYIAPEEDTGIMTNNSHTEDETSIVSHQTFSENPSLEISSTLVEELQVYQKKAEYNCFDLRQNIMKYTNPLRAKIVLYTALGNHFTFQTNDWVKLKQEELDDLLWKVFNACLTLEDLDIMLHNSIIRLGEYDEDVQAAGAIIQSMKKLYESVSYNQENLKNNLSPGNRVVINSDYQIAPTDAGDVNSYNQDTDKTHPLIEPDATNMLNKHNYGNF